MTRINRVQRLACLRSFATPQPARAPFLNARCVSSTQCLRVQEPPTQDSIAQEADYVSQIETRPTSSLALPPKQSIADTEEEIAAADPSYTPATSIAELETIAPIKSWWQQPGHWDSKNEFSGFGVAARQKITDPGLVKVLLRRAVLEVEALKKTGQYDALKFKRWTVGGKREMKRATVSELTPELAEEVVASLTAEETEKGSERVALPGAEKTASLLKTLDGEWLKAALDDETKFVLRKRLYQFTGTLIPDAKLAAATTVQHLATLASIEPRPAKLYQVLRAQTQQNPLPPNVKIHGRRITPIDREKAVGRWKVIEKELKMRDLPVTGFGDLPAHREKVWMQGKK
ncbi:ribosomal subunit 39S domain-containing protein [Sarocladium implicatum]|nr:ribosomal subunit 39S domain-containing protein [Sarocladium implicatum]